MEKLSLDTQCFHWDPNAQEQVWKDIRFVKEKGNFRAVAISDIPDKMILYRGKPISTFSRAENCSPDIILMKWAINIRKQIKSYDDTIDIIYPRQKEVSVENIFDKLNANRFGDNDQSHLYKLGSLFNHSCLYNAFRTDFGKMGSTMEIRANRTIKSGEEITIFYQSKLISIDNPQKRKEILFNNGKGEG